MRTLATEQTLARSLSTPLDEAIESFLRARWDLKPRTARGYAESLRRYAKHNKTLADLTADKVDDYLASIAPKRTMARNDCIALRQLSLWATNARIFTRNPLEAVSLPRGHGTKRRPYSETDVPIIVREAGRGRFGIRNRAMVMVALDCAIRPEENWSLELSDLNLRDGYIRIRPETTKSEAGERVVPIDPQTVAAVSAYLEDERPGKPGRLWLNRHGDPFKYAGFMEIWHDIRDRLKDKGIQVQAYRARHTGITDMAYAGVPLPKLQKIAGHKSIVTTQRYIGPLEARDLANLPRVFSAKYGRLAS